jgi:hypothetical protein
MLQKRPATLLALTILTFISVAYFLSSQPTRSIPIIPANSTLGFGTILSVSHTHSPRRSSLLWAANLTDIDIVIPPQPSWTNDDLRAFKALNGSQISRGSALAWMGHLHALSYFLTTTHSTALILEDDTDFSLHIRLIQIPLLAAAIRELFNTASTFIPDHNDYPNFWGPTRTWDILYPGHCDDLPSSLYTSHSSLTYSDPTSPPAHLLHPDTQNFLAALNVPGGQRIVHRALYPFCTFAYAVNRASAERILQEFRREKEGGISAFDVQLLQACRDGWACWSLGSEVFHHVVGGSQISFHDGDGEDGGFDGAGISENKEKWEGDVLGVGEKGERMRVEMEVPQRATWNLECGARHKDLWVEEGDVDGRRSVNRLVGWMIEKGECPVDKLGEEKRWKGCEWGQCGAQS